ncbi:hypothetical protein [Zobellia galactanivorans]|uniref:hypothetical protein n=1 Tax=Zobellia galactanivorans (strain DSM 12802 / CCUG 47099 / CIP 106680 / NCIMB 13871 / Dsij) TaxID=63186 RepID=UPI001C064E8B|nr:hypothetical protein [Zobellia galactanivorans]MBU3024795.1 hypothetical protein [Zobellia galactanivorans]
MKNWKFLFFICFCSMALSLQAQEISDNALGLRLGDSDGFGAEISYQRLIGRYTRAEFDLGYRDSREFDAIKLTGVYQWLYNIDRGFNWFYGAGAGLGSVDFAPVPNRNNPTIAEDPDGGLFVFLAGDAGVEYNFDLPIVVSLDFRPEIGLIGFSNFDNRFNFDIALGIRYQF